MDPYSLLVLAGGVGVAVILWLLMQSMRKRKLAVSSDTKIEKYVQGGNWQAAAKLQASRGNYEAALEYFLVAELPERAAQMARLVGRPQQAAELYEKAGQIEKAIAMYREAGLPRAADELERRWNEGQIAARQTDDEDDGFPQSPSKLEKTAESSEVGLDRQGQPAERAVDQWRQPGDDMAQQQAPDLMFFQDIGGPETSGEQQQAPEPQTLPGTEVPKVRTPEEEAIVAEILEVWGNFGEDAFADTLVRRPQKGVGPSEATAVEGLLEMPAVELMVSEVAEAASIRAAGLPQEPAVDAVMSEMSAARRVKRTKRMAFAPISITFKYANDDLVERARMGPGANELKTQLGGQPANPDNIETYYRLGLAQVGAGLWEEACKSFEAVCLGSPGHADAQERVEELMAWQDAVQQTMQAKLGRNPELAQRFTLLGELGRGGMAVVYRARDEKLRRDVALKFITEGVDDKKTMLELFQREVRAAAQVKHPNIVAVYDVGMLDRRPFISMELVEGVSIESLLEHQHRMTVLEALRVAVNILGALDHAHAGHIIHRDVKPSNMMRSRLGETKLMDFGLASSVGEQDETTVIAGTPNYMAPEQFTGKNIGTHSDVFAFGASLYQMLAGRPPFKDADRVAKPAALCSLNPTVPKLLESLVHRSMEFDLGKRIATAREMLSPIRQILASVSSFLSRHSRP